MTRDYFLQEELKIKRNLSGYHDSRVHACLYFITPNGHGLKSIDLVCMKKLDSKVRVFTLVGNMHHNNRLPFNTIQNCTQFKVALSGTKWHQVAQQNLHDCYVAEILLKNVLHQKCDLKFHNF